MKNKGLLLQERRDGWTVSGASPDSQSAHLPCTAPDEVAQAVLAFADLHSLDYDRLIIAVDSASVLFATIPASDNRAIVSSQSLRYVLESVLPIDAESIVADTFPRNDQSKDAVFAAIAMEVSHVQLLVNALESLKLKVQFIVPSSTLVFEQAIADKTLVFPSISVWLSNNEEPSTAAEVLVLDAERNVRLWQMMEKDIETIERNLSMITASFPSFPFVIFGNASEISNHIASNHSNSRCFSIDRDRMSKSRASVLLSGLVEPWIDLRRDDLALHDRWRRNRAAMTRLALAMVLLAFAVCGALIWRAQQYNTLANRIDQQQQDLFQRVFPGQRVPAAILGRVRSEHAKARGLRTSDDENATPKSVLGILPQIIESLAVDVPFEVKELRVENGTISIELEIASQEDAGMIAAELSKRGFVVEPPATTLVNGERILASYVATVRKADTPFGSMKEGLR